MSVYSQQLSNSLWQHSVNNNWNLIDLNLIITPVNPAPIITSSEKAVPSDIHTAFNPQCFILKDLKENTEATLTISRISTKGEAKDECLLKKEVFNKGVKFNVSPIISRYIKNAMNTPEELVDKDDYYIDPNLFTEYTVDIEVEPAQEEILSNYTYNLLCLNAVSQVGESASFDSNGGYFLTNYKKLRYYEGYPLDVTFISYDREVELEDKKGDVVKDSNGNNKKQETYFGLGKKGNIHDEKAHIASAEVYYRSICIKIKEDADYVWVSPMEGAPYKKLTDASGKFILDSNNDYICVLDEEYKFSALPIEKMPLPNNPFYVRWINRIGGWDYFMFSDKQTSKTLITKLEKFTPYFDNIEHVVDYDYILGMEAEKVITVGVDNITNYEFYNLRNILTSPKVQYFATDLDNGKGKWITLYVKKGDYIEDNSTPLNYFDLEFVLPQQQLQI